MIKIKAQIWVETVLYTLIVIVLIGAALTVISPKVKDLQDKRTIEQAVDTLEEINQKVLKEPGNTKIIFLSMKRGEFIVNGSNNKLSFIFDDIRSEYSEPNVPVDVGFGKKITTTKNQKGYSVEVWVDYSGRRNISFNGKDEDRIFAIAPAPYKISIETMGDLNGDDMQDVSIKELI